jgi:hypothetical protein
MTITSVLTTYTQPYPTFDLSGKDEPLVELKSILPDDDGVTRLQLSLNLAHYKGPSYTTIIRTWSSYSGQSGEYYGVRVDSLSSSASWKSRAYNVFSSPNTTNIHTHGPHISGELPGMISLPKWSLVVR